MSTFDARVLSLTPGHRLELYSIDLSPFGGAVERFTTSCRAYSPANLWSYLDLNPGTTAESYTALSSEIGQSDEVFISFYVRTILTTPTGYPAVRLYSGDPSTAVSYVSFGWLNDGSNSQVTHTGTDFTEGAMTVTVSGDYLFVTMRCTVATANTVYLSVLPSEGLESNLGTPAVGGMNAIFLERPHVYASAGGVPVPRPVPSSPASWVSINSGLGALGDQDYPWLAYEVPIWQGNAYTPLPIKATGFERSGQGQFPRPVLSMSNITGTGSLLLQAYGDIRGAEVTRVRVFADNLDNGIDPDPAAYFAPDVFLINRKSKENSTVVEFELVSRLDQQGAKLPARQVLRDVCPWIYRTWDASLNGGAGGFVYADDDVGCPYTGGTYYDIAGNTTANPEDDKCSKRLATGCRARYGKTEELPFGGFPMVGRQNY